MGNSTISTGPFSIANCNKLPEGICWRLYYSILLYINVYPQKLGDVQLGHLPSPAWQTWWFFLSMAMFSLWQCFFMRVRVSGKNSVIFQRKRRKRLVLTRGHCYTDLLMVQDPWPGNHPFPWPYNNRCSQVSELLQFSNSARIDGWI